MLSNWIIDNLRALKKDDVSNKETKKKWKQFKKNKNKLEDKKSNLLFFLKKNSLIKYFFNRGMRNTIEWLQRRVMDF